MPSKTEMNNELNINDMANDIEKSELVNLNQAFLIYQDDNGIARVNVRNRTHKKILLVRQEGSRSIKRQISHWRNIESFR